MGVESAKPPLPAPTDSSEPTGESVTGTDLATDVSRRTDRTSYSIPEDGQPITISTRPRRSDRDARTGLSHTSHQSQTSLLIEYFEAGRGGDQLQQRPSVRVKVTPSAARRLKENDEHIQITETSGRTRQPSYTKRISLNSKTAEERRLVEGADNKSLDSYPSATEESNITSGRPPVEIEVMRSLQSPLSAASSPKGSKRAMINTSEISSMPPDSLLDNPIGEQAPRRRSRSLTREEVVETSDRLKTPSRRRSRSLSRERITQKVIEKLGSKPRETSSRHKRSSKSRSRSVSKEYVEGLASPENRRSMKHRHEEDLTSGAESSLLTASHVSPRRRSGDQYSFRSGTSKSSLNNPKLLETVEDAIRRLILPELTALKREQSTQRNKTKFDDERRESITSIESPSRRNGGRRVSKTSSAPDVAGRPKLVLSRDEANEGEAISPHSSKGRRHRISDHHVDSTSERSYDRDLSEETVVLDDGKLHKKRSKDRHTRRNVAAAGLAGAALTAAALKHHDSRLSDDKERRRKRHSKSRSRSVSISESQEEFNKKDIPPMPLSSEVHGSELTRESILTADTERDHASPRGVGTPIRTVTVGSPLLRTPGKSPAPLQKSLGVHHSNESREDLSVHSAHSDRSLGGAKRATDAATAALAGAAVASGAILGEKALNSPTRAPRDYARGEQQRGLSPIQSVASYREDNVDEPTRDSYPRTQSTGSISSLNKGANISEKENLDEWYDQQHRQNDHYRASYDDESLRDSTIEVNRLTNYTDDSLEAPYLDRVTAGQHVQGLGANPEFRHTPVAVESAVASLHDPSVLGAGSNLSGRGDQSYPSSLNDPRHENGAGLQSGPSNFQSNGAGINMETQERDLSAIDPAADDPSYNRLSAADEAYNGPSHSIQALEEEIHMGASGLPVADDPLPEIGHGLGDESEISTNPSIIQGPIGGVQHGTRDHWAYEPSTPLSKGKGVADRDISHESQPSLSNEAAFLGVAGALGGMATNKLMAHGDGAEHYDDLDEQGSRDAYVKKDSLLGNEYDRSLAEDYGVDPHHYMDDPVAPIPPLKDEGYISAANARSPDITPEPKTSRLRDLGLYGDGQLPSLDDLPDDPFVTQKHARHLSGYSQGMPSPLYDGATGRGIDRIQSKDIVALMDHLTVRDAQRNARDTQILVTLVRSAAEMRNSFEDMKRLLAENELNLMSHASKNTDHVVQKLQGPRPQPLGTPRVPRRSVDNDDVEDVPTKRRNVFKRALKGLSMRSTNDLAKIEDMLVQLLGEVEGLKAGQDASRPSVGTQPNSINSYDNYPTTQEGYEPEGQAGTSSTTGGDQSGYSSNPPSRQAKYEGRRGSENRISTVLEDDEDLAEHEENILNNQFENNERLLTPAQEATRGGSAPPPNAPPQTQVQPSAHSAENTPRTEKSRKHKSSSSSGGFLPKISRWSETTASSVAKTFRGSREKERPYSYASRSGSDIHYQDGGDGYQPMGDDRLYSPYSAENDPEGEENRPPSPLVPSNVSEDPKFQGYRNSMNLQHPQPRPGPTPRYQHQLETQAQNFGSPESPASDQWGSNPSLARYPSGQGARHSGGGGGFLPTISDAGYSELSTGETSAAPPRPPKIPTEPLVPARPAKIRVKDGQTDYESSSMSPGRLAVPGDGQRQASGSGYKNNDSPRSISEVPQRKPTGPRPLSSTGNYSPDRPGGSRRQRDRNSQATAGTFGSNGDDEDVTF